MTFDEYEKASMRHSVMYPKAGDNFIYPALKLAGEAGEAADKIGKLWRNHDVTNYTELSNNPRLGVEGMWLQIRLGIMKELGDVLWYITALARELHSSLDEVAQLNIVKVNDRVSRGKILGEGDSR